MKKIVLTSIGALMMSVVAAGAAEPCKSCDQTNYRIFFGINAGVHGWNYSTTFDTILESLLPTVTGMAWGVDNVIKIENPKNETMVGMEGGVRFGKHSAVWNGGFTIAADKTMGKKPNITAPEDFWNDPTGLAHTIGASETTMQLASALAKDFKFHTNIISASFDNYIRLNKSRENRLDLVAGVGIADIETNMNLWGVGMSFASHAAMLKAGLELELTENISVTLGSRMYVPVSSQFYASQYDLKGGFKFLF